MQFLCMNKRSKLYSYERFEIVFYEIVGHNDFLFVRHKIFTK